MNIFKEKKFSSCFLNNNFKNLFLAQTISSFGDWISYIILPLIIYNITKSPVSIAIFTLCKLLPSLFLTNKLKKLSNKYSIKNILVFCDFGRFILYFGYIFTNNSIVMYILTIVISILSLIFNPLKYSIVPQIVEEDFLDVSNSLLSSSSNFMMVIGPAIGGIVYSLGGGRICLIINAFSFIFSAIFINKVSVKPREGMNKNEGHLKKANLNVHLGFVLMGFIIINSIVDGAFGSLNTLLPIMYNNSNILYGTIISILGFGMLIGGLVTPFLTKNNKSINIYIIVSLISIIFLSIFAVSKIWILSCICVFIFSFANGVQEVIFVTYVQKNAADNVINAFSLSQLFSILCISIITIYVSLAIKYIKIPCTILSLSLTLTIFIIIMVFIKNE